MGETNEFDFAAIGIKVKEPKSSFETHKEDFDLDAALAAKEDPTEFVPTNFHVIWPQRPVYKANSWKVDADEDPNRRKTSKDFPKRLLSQTSGFNKINLPAIVEGGKRSIIPTVTEVTPGPGAFAPPVISASVNLSHTSLRPPKPLFAVDQFLMSISPSSASYSPDYSSVEPNLHNVTFGWGNKVTQLSSIRLLHSSSTGGPGTYNSSLPHHKIPSLNFEREARHEEDRVNPQPGPGQYNPRPQIANNFNVHFSPSRPEVHWDKDQRARGPGTYTLPQATAQSFRFSMSPRFEGETFHKALHILSAAHQLRRVGGEKSTAPHVSFIAKAHLKQYSRKAAEARLQEAKEAHEERDRQAELRRHEQLMVHKEKIDKIVHRKQYQEEMRDEREEALRITRLQMGWLFNVYHLSRFVTILDAIKTQRHFMYMTVLKRQAASVIVFHMRRYLLRKHATQKMHAGLVIMRAMKCNVRNARVARNRHAGTVLATFFNQLRMRLQVIAIIHKFRYQAIIIQRSWRRFSKRRKARLYLLHHQWDYLEQMLCTKYKDEYGIAKYEQAKKRGLLGNQVGSKRMQRKMIESVVFFMVPMEIKRDVIFDDYQARVTSYLHAVHEQEDNEEYRKILLAFAQARIDAAVKEAGNEGELPPEITSLQSRLLIEEAGDSEGLERWKAEHAEKEADREYEIQQKAMREEKYKKLKEEEDRRKLASNRMDFDDDIRLTRPAITKTKEPGVEDKAANTSQLNDAEFFKIFLNMPSPLPKVSKFQVILPVVRMSQLIQSGYANMQIPEMDSARLADMQRMLREISKTIRKNLKDKQALSEKKSGKKEKGDSKEKDSSKKKSRDVASVVSAEKDKSKKGKEKEKEKEKEASKAAVKKGGKDKKGDKAEAKAVPVAPETPSKQESTTKSSIKSAATSSKKRLRPTEKEVSLITLLGDDSTGHLGSPAILIPLKRPTRRLSVTKEEKTGI